MFQNSNYVIHFKLKSNYNGNNTTDRIKKLFKVEKFLPLKVFNNESNNLKHLKNHFNSLYTYENQMYSYYNEGYLL